MSSINKLAIYRRSRSGFWQCRFKLANGEWYRQTTGTDDQEEATDIAYKLFYSADAKDKNNLPQNTRKFANVARLAVQRMTDELDAGAGKGTFRDYIRVINGLPPVSLTLHGLILRPFQIVLG